MDYVYAIPEKNHLPEQAKRQYEQACNTALQELHAMLSNGVDGAVIVAWWCKWRSIATDTHLGKALAGYAKYVNLSM